MIGFRGTSCILYVHKHRTTSPRDDECGCAQYRRYLTFLFSAKIWKLLLSLNSSCKLIVLHFIVLVACYIRIFDV